MKNAIYALLITGALVQAGCSKEFWGGAAVGALGAGGGYEYGNKRQMDRLEDDYRAGRIDREEYQDRKKQVERGSLIY
jgi:osmotically-inducible protein OsmY